MTFDNSPYSNDRRNYAQIGISINNGNVEDSLNYFYKKNKEEGRVDRT